MVDAEEVSQRGLEVVDVDRVLDPCLAEFVSFAVGLAAFAAAGHPHREGLSQLGLGCISIRRHTKPLP